MSKLSQLQLIKSLGLPTPAFIGVSWEDFRSGSYREKLTALKFPIAVRSSHSEEDDQHRSQAGHFRTCLNVEEPDVRVAMQQVFESYGNPEGQVLILQDMIEAKYQGVLFAHREGVWRVEYQGEQGVVDGRSNPETLLLPRFVALDYKISRFRQLWQPFGKGHKPEGLIRPLIQLSVCAQTLLKDHPLKAPLGLDIEFVISRGRLYLLQARPITTGGDNEEVLTSANHKEILPPQPSVMMTALIESCSVHLFAYYQRLDPSLPSRRFIEVAGRMPWINLSALLDTMVDWGLPTSLVCKSVGAEDFYRVKIRLHRWMYKWPVFLRVLRDQFKAIGKVRRWVRQTQRYLLTELDGRRLMWRNNPDLAFNNWLTNLQLVYTELVNHMQTLTGAMSGPVRLFDKLGILPQLRDRSESTRYMEAYRWLVEGKLSKEEFLKAYGHRGFYESDIGQKRFFEYSEEEWKALLGDERDEVQKSQRLARREPVKGNFLIKLLIRLIHTREWLRNYAMRYFWWLRQEIQEVTEARFGPEVDFSAFAPEDLLKALEGEIDKEELLAISYPPGQGWVPDTFLFSRLGRQQNVNSLSNLSQAIHLAPDESFGIYPGRVKGQVWRVSQADLQNLEKPSFDTTILFTDSLDPGWIPYFVKVDAVVSKVGGILSHASIILRESQIPSITRFQDVDKFQTGDWVEVDGKTGEVRKVLSE